MSAFEKMCMTMFVIIVAINIGIQAFAVGMEDTQEMLPKEQAFIDYDYTASFSDLNTSINKFYESLPTANVLGVIVYGLGAIGALGSIVLKGFLGVLTGYFDLTMYFADAIEPGYSWNGIGSPIGGIHLLFSAVGTIMSVMVAYGLFVIARSILVK